MLTKIALVYDFLRRYTVVDQREARRLRSLTEFWAWAMVRVRNGRKSKAYTFGDRNDQA
jgi:hypothetical protein